MKSRLPALVLFALALISTDASAQKRAENRRADAQKVETFGSVARTKLLKQARGRSLNSQDALRLGSTERRALLTGATVQYPRPQQQRKHWR